MAAERARHLMVLGATFRPPSGRIVAFTAVTGGLPGGTCRLWPNPAADPIASEKAQAVPAVADP
ncbi:hypothetical protein [Notoacmeibacter marinus]|uniref:hypothetical protein n=1 Tax=Notoacmeibacter marinus TaxID=1876515 RepID=UPI000DF11868|nr:hypothetical protein [Notoacmeibacter marinus]